MLALALGAEQLHIKARQDHEDIVDQLARSKLRKLDALQANLLHSIPFGSRCVRGLP